MLFGTEKYRNSFFGDIKNICKDRDYTIVYAGTVGSISRGISSNTSDYDVKCLYYKDSALNIDYHKEESIRYRHFYNDRAYNCVAFWDIFAFFNFLSEPYIDSGNRYELLHNVYWLMLTPYAWDPLGLQEKLFFDICKCMDCNNEILYHHRMLEKIINEEMPIQRKTLRLLHSFLSIEWIEKNNSIPPISIMSLVSQGDTNERHCYHNVLRKLGEANEVGRSIPDYDEDLQNVIKMATEKNKEMISKGFHEKTYNFMKCKDNKCYVDNIIETIKLSIECVPQFEGEAFLTYKEICKI